MAQFANGKYDDIADSATQALNWLRKIARLRTDEERRLAQETATQNLSRRNRKLYDA
jgi:hypothetical protein